MRSVALRPEEGGRSGRVTLTNDGQPPLFFFLFIVRLLTCALALANIAWISTTATAGRVSKHLAGARSGDASRGRRLGEAREKITEIWLIGGCRGNGRLLSHEPGAHHRAADVLRFPLAGAFLRARPHADRPRNEGRAIPAKRGGGGRKKLTHHDQTAWRRRPLNLKRVRQVRGRQTERRRGDARRRPRPHFRRPIRCRTARLAYFTCAVFARARPHDLCARPARCQSNGRRAIESAAPPTRVLRQSNHRIFHGAASPNKAL